MDFEHALVHWGLVVLAALILIASVARIGIARAFGDPAALLSLVLTLAFVRGAAHLPVSLSLAILAVTFILLVYVLVLVARRAKGSGEGAA